MPRANRYFLPGYVWHITHLQSFCSKRSNRSMVRQAHHDRLDLPLVLSLVEGCAPFKSLELGASSIRLFGSLRVIDALLALAFRGEEALRFVRAELHGHIQSHSSSGQRHWSKRHRREHAAHRRSHTRLVVQKFKVQWFKVRGQRGSKLSGFSDLRDFQTAHRQ